MTQVAPNVERVDIIKPVVTDSIFDYKTIVFRSGDEIAIDAGGCVQTGGRGSTWKRYVNPRGENSNRLYFGSMQIPGVLAPTRFSELLGQTIVMPAIEPTTLVLRYRDDNYGDNGYYSHDNGIGGQCAGPLGGPAHVTLTITHADAPPPPPPVPPQACVAPRSELLWDLDTAFSPDPPFDDNCLLLNPRWKWQAPGVIGAPSFDRRLATRTATDNSAACLVKTGLGEAGHVNWVSVTYNGTVQWGGHDWSYPFGDDDYNMFIRPTTSITGSPYKPGGTLTNRTSIKGEFDSEETIDDFDKSPWWNRFHRSVDIDGHNESGRNTLAARMVNGHDAVMTGLMSLDTFHSDNSSEIHPVHALAIRAAAAPNPAEDRWAIFVRNWGNQGYCGSSDHLLSRQSMRVRIPRPPGLPDAAIGRADLQATKFYKHNAPNLGKPYDFQVRAIPGGDVIVTFFLNSPTQHSFQFGELYLRWRTPVVEAVPGEPNAAAAVAAPEDDDEEADGPEESAGERELLASLSPAERSDIESRMRAALPVQQVETEESRASFIVGEAEPPDEPAPFVFEGPDERKEKVREVSYGALCAVTRGSTPQVPGLCEATTTLRGDLDGDRDVDRDDLKILRPSINRSVERSACGIRCDLDDDGKITVHDGWKLIRVCTWPLCLTKAPEIPLPRR